MEARPNPLHVAVTGTQTGGTVAQLTTLSLVLLRLSPDVLRHGGAQGVDLQAAAMVSNVLPFSCQLIRCPATGGLDEPCYDVYPRELVEDPAGGHFARNRALSIQSHVVIGVPYQQEEPSPNSGGGTWYTIGYHRKRNMPSCIIWHDGREEWFHDPKNIFGKPEPATTEST